jgi:uncharacterized protein
LSCHVDGRIARLEERVREVYEQCVEQLPFHGWPHIEFVRKKATQFARERDADPAFVEAAALVYDLNYVAKRNSALSAGAELRRECLEDAGYGSDEVELIERLIQEAHTATRTDDISPAGSALSDADTLFKALPVTPVLLAHRYLAENGIGLRTLAEKILDEQRPLLDHKIYFYDRAVAERYLPWAQANLELWAMVIDALGDDDVTELLDSAGLTREDD